MDIVARVDLDQKRSVFCKTTSSLGFQARTELNSLRLQTTSVRKSVESLPWTDRYHCLPFRLQTHHLHRFHHPLAPPHHHCLLSRLPDNRKCLLEPF